ncbi:UDP-glycosyltransferase 83A1-like [Abrus precatorius]|uniref:UDP-glycosyltransferase 83A1-like n=1 Tax=Abrus precatorius TaxID=3816 RepID=A0A8B8LW02_ABRPR|nr:UDP-glycosyltransferase 83A1-like [Abrus precatorius]
MNIPTILVLPYPAQGHVNPLMTLSQKLVENGCKVIFVNTHFNHERVVSSMADQLHNMDESMLKLVSISDGLRPEDDRKDLGKLCDTILRTMPSTFEKLIDDIHLNSDNRINFIVADMCMGWAFDVGTKLGIKGAMIWPASVSMLALICNIPKLIDDGIIDSDGGLKVTTKNTIRISPIMSDMDPRTFFWLNMGDTTTGKIVLNYLVQCAQCINLTEWCLCNTAYELESRPLSFSPNLLPIGPLLRSYDNSSATTKSIGQFWEEDFSCINWLDQQPHHSVVYVAFGSFTLFDQNQFNEIALGLDLTNRPFLWVVRKDNKMACPHEFKGSKGKIVEWAPQQKVLSHPAIACFVSHCGWNSTMEGLSNGVPFLCWPYFGDQMYNKTYICDELKIGFGFDLDKNGLVSCEEFKMKVDQLLSDENIISRSLELKEKLIKNIARGGLSSKNFNRFVKWLKE